MSEKEERTQAEKYAQELIRMLNAMSDEIEKAANKFGKMGEQAYESMPSKAKAMTKDLQTVVDSVSENLKRDIPKMQKNLEGMAKRVGDYAEDVSKALKGSKK
jgi:uncharacterized protein YukE